MIATNLILRVRWIGVSTVIVRRAESDAVVVGTGVGRAAEGSRAQETGVAGGRPCVEGGVWVAVGAGGVAGVTGIGDCGAAGEKVAEVDALVKGIGVGGAKGVIAANLLAAVDLVLVSECIGVDGAVLRWARWSGSGGWKGGLG